MVSREKEESYQIHIGYYNRGKRAAVPHTEKIEKDGPCSTTQRCLLAASTRGGCSLTDEKNRKNQSPCSKSSFANILSTPSKDFRIPRPQDKISQSYSDISNKRVPDFLKFRVASSHTLSSGLFPCATIQLDRCNRVCETDLGRRLSQKD